MRAEASGQTQGPRLNVLPATHIADMAAEDELGQGYGVDETGKVYGPAAPNGVTTGTYVQADTADLTSGGAG